MSDGQCPTPQGYKVYTSRQCCDGNLDNQRPYADAYICPECGRIMIFGRDSDRYMLYKAESIENYAKDGDNTNIIDKAIEESESELVKTGDYMDAENVLTKPKKSFSDGAWATYSELSEREDTESIKTVEGINSLIQKLQDDGIRELSVRNIIVGSEHQLCYRVHEGVIEVISIEWIFE